MLKFNFRGKPPKTTHVKVPITGFRKIDFFFNLALSNSRGVTSGFFFHDSELIVNIYISPETPLGGKATLTFTFTFKVIFISNNYTILRANSDSQCQKLQESLSVSSPDST